MVFMSFSKLCAHTRIPAHKHIFISHYFEQFPAYRSTSKNNAGVILQEDISPSSNMHAYIIYINYVNINDLKFYII